MGETLMMLGFQQLKIMLAESKKVYNRIAVFHFDIY